MTVLVFIIAGFVVAFVLALLLSIVGTAIGLAIGIIDLALRIIPVVLVIGVAAYFLSGGRIVRDGDGNVVFKIPSRRPRR